MAEKTGQDPKAEKTGQEPKAVFTAVIFDPTLEPERNGVFAAFGSFMGTTKAPNPSPSALMLARMPIAREGDGNGYLPAPDPLLLRPGTNLGVNCIDIDELEATTAPAIAMYRKRGSFRCFSPEIPGAVGDRFRHYSEADAVLLIGACLSISALEAGIEGEDRYAVKDAYNGFHSALKEELTSRAAAAG
jgi:hypothetical protein